MALTLFAAPAAAPPVWAVSLSLPSTPLSALCCPLSPLHLVVSSSPHCCYNHSFEGARRHAPTACAAAPSSCAHPSVIPQLRQRALLGWPGCSAGTWAAAVGDCVAVGQGGRLAARVAAHPPIHEQCLHAFFRLSGACHTLNRRPQGSSDTRLQTERQPSAGAAVGCDVQCRHDRAPIC